MSTQKSLIITQVQLGQHLRKIQLGQPVNFNQLVRNLKQVGLSDNQISKLLKYEQIGSSQSITILNQPLFEQLLNQYHHEMPKNRQDASQQGNSHRAKVSYSYLLRTTFNIVTNTIAYPEVMMFSDKQVDMVFSNNKTAGDIVTTNIATKPNLLIIENRECFFGLHLFASKFKNLNIPIALENCDIVLGEGGQVQNHFHDSLFCQYEKVFLLFDIDLGGITLYCNLKRRFQDSSYKVNIVLLYPTDIEAYLEVSKRPLKAATRQQLVDIAQRNLTDESLNHLITLMCKTGHILEQENYMADWQR